MGRWRRLTATEGSWPSDPLRQRKTLTPPPKTGEGELLRQHPHEADRRGEALERHVLLADADLGQQGLHRRIVGDTARDHDVAALALALQAGRHVHRRAEIIEPIVEIDHHARPRMNAEL